jgi:hypothetical protein
VDESTNIGGKAQLVILARFIEDEEIVEKFLFCKELEGTTTEEDVFNILKEYLQSIGLPSQSCVGMCTDMRHHWLAL